MTSSSQKDPKFTKVLVVEDEPQILRLIELELKYEGYDVITCTDGKEALSLVREHNPDLILLDCMLPGLSGEEVCVKLRDEGFDQPIIFITAKDGIDDKVKCLDSGADDYLAKPFVAEELLARIRAIFRRKAPGQSSILIYGDLWLDQLSRSAKRKEEDLSLRTKEFSLLRIFMMHPEEYLTREFLFNKVWGYDFIGESNVIEVYIRYLRSKLMEKRHGKLIHTKRGSGYMLKQPVKAVI
ncbi:MAG: response regulator transcription factor [Candidatus Caenarcaniphilales bacterium]|nr:response regulator transcription factor [Candidatus Caenarcaniphilales bacterium]